MPWLGRNKKRKRRERLESRTLEPTGNASALTYKRVGDVVWEIPRTGAMRVPARIYTTAEGLERLKQDNAPVQAANVAQLPGIVGYSLAMPDIHWGYGFPIGGVAATDPAAGGVISPGGVGYDINCGCRLVATDLTRADVEGKMSTLVQALFAAVPTGVGAHQSREKLTIAEARRLVTTGAGFVVDRGKGGGTDLAHTEEEGCLAEANPEIPSTKAYQRGLASLGTLGSGNHFLEVGVVEEIYDAPAARAFGLERDAITVLIHTGSRGFGHQVCVDHLQDMGHAGPKYGITVPDRQLAAVPVESPEGQAYLSAMRCAANYAWANRQVIQHLAEGAFQAALGIGPADLRWRLVYDVCHNIAKMETHTVDGEAKRLCVHRKGATRAFPAGHPEVPEEYRAVGQPVLVPGDMGRPSFVCVGLPGAMEQTFGSTCHGAGRALSRKQAMKRAQGRSIQDELLERGVTVMAKSRATLGEEMPEAYKDAAEVVDVMHRAGVSGRVARLRPLGVIKG